MEPTPVASWDLKAANWALEATSDSFVLLDRDYKILHVNAAFLRSSRDPSREFLGKNIWETWPELISTVVEDRFRAATKSGEPQHFEFLHEPSGTWLDIHAHPASSNLNVFFRDITKLKTFESDLINREIELKRILDALPDIAWATDATGAMYYINSRWRDYTGEDGMVLERIRECIHPDDLTAVMETMAHSRATGEYHPYELRLRRRDGEHRWHRVRPSPLVEPDGAIRGWIGTSSDVHDEVLAREASRESEARFRALADNIDQLAWMADASGWISWYNRRWHEYTGTTPEEMQGWGWAKVHDPACLPLVMERWKASIESGEAFDMEFPLRGADGTFRTFLTRIHPIKDVAGQVTMWVGTNTDVSELRNAEYALRRANQELELKVSERTARLEAANKELQGFNYAIAHDLRAPLRAITSGARILLEEASGTLSNEHRLLLTRQAANAKHLAQLIDDLLTYSRLAREPVRREQLDVTSIAETVAEEIRRERGNEILVQKGLSAEGDPGLLNLVFHNLIDNAAKFSPSGGKVEVGRSNGAFYVRDYGVGFDMQFASKLFQPFERLVRQEEFPGTGIGLANVKRIVERHGGRVWVHSHPGKGATFWFTVASESAQPDA